MPAAGNTKTRHDRRRAGEVSQRAFELLRGHFVVDEFGQISRFVDGRWWRGRFEILEERNALGFSLSMREMGEALRSPWPDPEHTAWTPYSCPDWLLREQALFLCPDFASARWIARVRRCQEHRFHAISGEVGPRDHLSDRAEAVVRRRCRRLRDEGAGESSANLQFVLPDEAWSTIIGFRNRLQDRWWVAATRALARQVGERFPSASLRWPTPDFGKEEK